LPTTSEGKGMDKELFDVRIDKRFFSVASLSDQSNDKDYWFSKYPVERMRHIEVLRRINYGYRAVSRLQRVLEVAEE
jgi:hypothetical protein